MKLSKIVAAVLLMALVALTCCGCMGQIEDVNGEDDRSLNTLTEEELLNGNSYSTVNSFNSQSKGNYTFKAGKFSGVRRLESITLTEGAKTITADVAVTAGNFRMVLVKDGTVVFDFALEGDSSVTLSESGKYEIKIAGESAAFELSFSIVS